MGRVEKDYRILLIDTMQSIREHSTVTGSSLVNDRHARNNYIELINTLEDFMWPILLEHDYKQPEGDDEIETGHLRLREIIRIARDTGIITPREIYEDLSDFSIDDISTA